MEDYRILKKYLDRYSDLSCSLLLPFDHQWQKYYWQCSGVYVLFADEKIMYIGSSKRMKTRLNHHLNRINASKKMDFAIKEGWISRVLFIAYSKHPKKLEWSLIERIQPILNEAGITKTFY